MKLSNDIQPAVQAAIPIVLGYIAVVAERVTLRHAEE